MLGVLENLASQEESPGRGLERTLTGAVDLDDPFAPESRESAEKPWR